MKNIEAGCIERHIDAGAGWGRTKNIKTGCTERQAGAIAGAIACCDRVKNIEAGCPTRGRDQAVINQAVIIFMSGGFTRMRRLFRLFACHAGIGRPDCPSHGNRWLHRRLFRNTFPSPRRGCRYQ
jgi:hypothetical protein